MKQVKFFLVALMAVVMGMSVTSCMNGDDNHNVTMTVPVKYNFGSFLMGDATTKLVPTTESTASRCPQHSLPWRAAGTPKNSVPTSRHCWKHGKRWGRKRWRSVWRKRQGSALA